MNLPPLVSIVMPVFDDAPTIEAALRSAMAQTLDQIEIIVVDDASTDGTQHIVARLAQDDPRVRLVRQPENMSAFQGRRRGIDEAQAPYVMFLDGDDEMERHAAAKAARLAQTADADLVQFGIRLVCANAAGTMVGFERRLQPRHRELSGDDIGLGLFPPTSAAGGQIWKYLFRADLLREVYAMLPSDLRLHRANDLPITYLAAVTARRYVSTPERLYRYHFQRGASGNRPETIDDVAFHTIPLDAVDCIADAVQEAAYRHGDPQALLDSYASVRLSIISLLFRYLVRIDDPALIRDALVLLERRTSRIEMVRAAVRFQPDFLMTLAQHSAPDPLGARPVRSVLVTTSQLTTGGVSGVLLAQATMLRAAGHRVTFAAQRSGSDLDLLPDGVAFYEVSGKNLAERLDHWAEICRAEEVDVVIEHRVLYSRQWPAFALMARACGAPTIGWIHNFAGRPTYDLNDLHTFIVRSVPVLAQLVVLSPLDVAFWKLRGIERTAYLPNPPSPMMLEHGVAQSVRTSPGGRVELVWVGRLDQHTKQVRALLDVAEALRQLGADFHLTVIGPEWPGLTVQQLNDEAAERGIDDLVEAVGPRTGQDLVDALDGAHAFVGTSVIEGYQLTLVEAQARGLPVFMYEMPWLVPVQDNEGLVAVQQADAKALAAQIVRVMADPERYADLSRGSLAAARRAFDDDFPDLYERLVTGSLPDRYSPQPTLADAATLLDLTIFFAEQHAGMRQQLAATRKTLHATKKDLVAARRRSARRDADQPVVQPVARQTARPGASTTPTRRRPLWRRLGSRVKRTVLRTRAPKTLQITEGKIVKDEVRLTLTPCRRGVPVSLDAYRDVDGTVQWHAFTLTPQKDGSVAASLGCQGLDSRRWRLRATYDDPAGPVEIAVPIPDGVFRRSDGAKRVRTFDGTTMQVVPV